MKLPSLVLREARNSLPIISDRTSLVHMLVFIFVLISFVRVIRAHQNLKLLCSAPAHTFGMLLPWLAATSGLLSIALLWEKKERSLKQAETTGGRSQQLIKSAEELIFHHDFIFPAIALPGWIIMHSSHSCRSLWIWWKDSTSIRSLMTR